MSNDTMQPRRPLEILYGERDRVGDFTLLVGDLVQFHIATDRRDKLQRATNIKVLDASFTNTCEKRSQVGLWWLCCVVWRSGGVVVCCLCCGVVVVLWCGGCVVVWWLCCGVVVVVWWLCCGFVVRWFW